ncbi:MAG: DUF2304 family protein [Methylomonas sp.]
MIAQIVLTLALLGSLVYVMTQKRLLGGIRLSLYVVITAGLFFVWSPNQSTAIANFIGIGRGADLVYYIWVILSLAVFINIHIKLRENNALVTQLARQIAIVEAQRGMHDAPAQALNMASESAVE